MKIIYFSKGIRGTRCLEHLLRTGYTVAAVVAVVREDDLLSLSEKYAFPILYPEKINTEDMVQELSSFEADLFVLCGYNKILKSIIIDIPPLGTINLHGGKLPEYRGAAPINWQIINGETSGGCSIIYVDEGIDTGDIIAQEIYPINPDDTHASVLEKTLTIFPSLLERVLNQIEDGTVSAVPQDLNRGGYYRRRYPRDSQIDWVNMTDIQVHNLVRGMHGPYPAAYSFLDDLKVEFDQTRILDENLTGRPGVVKLDPDLGFIVFAKNRGLAIEQITVAGKSASPEKYLNAGDLLINKSPEEGLI
jgi:methionyl-tRNA formyltransferase